MLAKLRERLYRKSKDRVHIQIIRGDKITPNNDYVIVKLRSARIATVQRGWTKFYPCIYSYIRFLHDKESEVEVSSIVRPSKLLELDATNLDKVIVHDHTILNAVAYRGGPLEIELGVCALKSSSLAAPYLQLLDEIAAASGVGVLEAARPFSRIVGRGVELLLGSGDDVRLEVGLHAELDAVEGVYAIIDETKAAAGKTVFEVDPSDGKLLMHEKVPYVDASYCVYEVQLTKEKHNWRKIASIASSFDKINDALERNEFNQAEEERKRFSRLCVTSPDLVPNDANRLIESVKNKCAAVERIGLSASKTRKPLGSLEEIDLYPAK